MAGIERLVETASLDFGRLEKATDSGEPAYMRYDDAFDALTVLTVVPATDTTVHYLSDQVAVLYLPDSHHVVGFQIEDWVSRFLPEHVTLKRLWDQSYKSKDVGELVATVEKVIPKVAKELYRLTELMMVPA